MATCRFCDTPLSFALVDLGEVPLANSYLSTDQLEAEEPRFSLKPLVCEECFLVQVPEWESPEAIFSDYAYFSSVSRHWLEHARVYCEHIRRRLDLGAASRVIEVASNDGYLLRNFVRAGIPVLGIEPARNVGEVAVEKGIPTLFEFFGEELARRLLLEGGPADLVIANNVLAHTPHLHDFVSGIAAILGPQGVATLEFPHLLRLIEETLFDTIYHEHYSYFSFSTVREIFRHHGLDLFDVEELPTHGGSLRIYAAPVDAKRPVSTAVEDLLARETASGIRDLRAYASFEARVREVRDNLLRFLETEATDDRTVLGYGAPAKGNTLLCYCGIDSRLVPFTVDLSPHKQNLFLPGSHLPIADPQDLVEARPDHVLILPWNLKEEIMEQMQIVRTWGGRFVTAIPQLEIHE